MKKIISILLVLTCALALCACDKIPVIGGLFGKDPEAAFEEAVEKTNPSKALIETTVDGGVFGELKTSVEIVYSNDGSAVINYEYDHVNSIGEGNGELVSKITGTVTRAADGTYSGDMEAFDPSTVSAGVALKISELPEGTTTINEAGDVLTSVIPASGTAAVFGNAMSKDVTLEVTISGGVVTYVTLTYEGGRTVCRYE